MSAKKNVLSALHLPLLCVVMLVHGFANTLQAMATDPHADMSSLPQLEESVPSRTMAALPKRIKTIFVQGNLLIPTETILAKIPYREGDIFKPQRARAMIQTLHKLGSLSDIQLAAEVVAPDAVDLYISVQEKKQVADFAFSGNRNLKREEVEKKFKISEIKFLDEEELANIVAQIKTLYAEKDYHHVEIEARLITTDEKTVAQFDITEGSRTHVQRVFIQGNTRFSNKKIRELLFTREDWLLGFLNKAGSFQPDALEYDKSLIENFYQNQGYLAAQVNNVAVDPVPNSSNVNVTFCVDEGDLYVIESVKAPGNAILSEEELLQVIPVKPGQLYSRELIRQTIEAMRMLWGEHGYIYAEVDPSIIPDENKKTVQVEFHTTLGNCMTLRRMTIVGNKKTKDKVIRRQILLDEGELLTTRRMELSKERVQALGYFDPRNGVNWKIIKLDEENADLELLLQEVKTGSMYAQLGTGGVLTDKNSPSDTFRVSAGLQDINFLGSGIQINLNGSYSRQERSVDFSISDPWLFDRPLFGGLSLFHRRSTFDEFRATKLGEAPSALDTGVGGQLGFAIGTLTGTPFQALAGSNALFEAGYEHLKFRPVLPPADSLKPLYDRKFHSGDQARIGLNFAQDARNHPVMPSRGYIWNMGAKFGLSPHMSCPDSFGFFKWEFDFQWYTPLINEYDLILRFHTFAGIIKEFGNHTIPYRELYNIGGPATVRGFLYGQIGPLLVSTTNPVEASNAPLGGKRAFTASLELLFPIAPDGSIRGCLFYDGGTGWDTPDTNLLKNTGFSVRNNSFDYRHAIGFGIRLTRPSPVRIDVGFKLDRRKRLGEPLSEFHFTMAQDF